MITIGAQSLLFFTQDEKIYESNKLRYDIGRNIYYVNLAMKIIMGLSYITESLIYFKRSSIDGMLQTLFEEAESENI